MGKEDSQLISGIENREQGKGRKNTLIRGGLRLFRGLAFTTALTAAAITLPGYLPPLNPAFQYEIDRKGFVDYFFDFAIRPAPRVFMEVKATGKLTHDLDWVDTKINPSFQCLKIEGDPELMGRENFFQGKWFEVNRYNWSKVKISLGGWWQVFQLQPKNPVSSWHFKFQGEEKTGYGQRLRFGFSDAIRVLQGNQNYLACGEDDFGNEVPLEKEGPFPRWDRTIAGPLV